MTPKQTPAALAYVGSTPGAKPPGRDSDSWFTPGVYVDAARRVMGGISLDPFSSEAANRIVKARRFYTAADDAFSKSWRAKSVWMNPPYSAALCYQAAEKFAAEFKAGKIGSGIVLVNNATETRAFRRLLGACSGVCFTNHRISFWNADGKPISGNTRGQVFFYFGDDPEAFARLFRKFGPVSTGNFWDGCDDE